MRSASHPLPLEASNHLSTGTSCGAIGSEVFGGERPRKELGRGDEERCPGTTARFKDAVGPSGAAACPVGRETRRDVRAVGEGDSLAGRFVLRLCRARGEAAATACSRDTV